MRVAHGLLPCSAVALVCALAACDGTRPGPATNAAANATQPAIELLGFPDCPNTPAMRDHLEAALASMGRGWTFKDTNQEELPENDLRRGWPTPTILINGDDLFGMPAPTGPSMGCRMYPDGVPDAKHIADKIKAATER